MRHCATITSVRFRCHRDHAELRTAAGLRGLHRPRISVGRGHAARLARPLERRGRQCRNQPGSRLPARRGRERRGHALALGCRLPLAHPSARSAGSVRSRQLGQLVGFGRDACSLGPAARGLHPSRRRAGSPRLAASAAAAVVLVFARRGRATCGRTPGPGWPALADARKRRKLLSAAVCTPRRCRSM